MSLPTHTCTRCGLPVHMRDSRCRDCRHPYSQETTMPAHRARTITRPADHLSTAVPLDEDWRQGAACGVGTWDYASQGDPWFPDRGTSDTISDAASDAAHAMGKRICLTQCPAEVREKCLTLALERRETRGVWGGLSPRERRAQTAPKPVPASERAEIARDLLDDGATHAQIAATLRISKTTVARLLAAAS